MQALKFIWYVTGISTMLLILINNPKSNTLGFNSNGITSSRLKKNINKFILISAGSFVILTIALGIQ
uniref:preprotein translocase subunit G n=1 Tax=Porphyridium aerugineum TaxID=2792 RepID=UPI001FCCF32C|nr:preprotein translocase subunit G [Porphyridium aerugineum]UNJ17848.1 preprotein translocase subunit G [Porphyridium aerugineum]